VLIFTLVLHPGLKLEYFKQKDWEEEWINNAEELVRKAYSTRYEGKESSTAPTPDITAEPVSTHIVLSILILIMRLQLDNDEFATFANISVTKNVGYRSSELDEYLRKPVENVQDPLKWWFTNRHVYPSLYRMALDYLSIPGEFYFIFCFFNLLTNLFRSYVYGC
jgi:hypothetical protein